ncbi:MAG TPA: YkgJ family cysteine cluster protein [Kofleriaceae bacterium]|nr:YkgJ family cysteine cluster protein [Kofleriaceae bacterium]
MSGRYAELVARVDAFFARAAARHGADMQCRAGCTACCRAGLTVTGVEAAAIEEEVGRLPEDTRRRLARRLAAASTAAAAPHREAASGQGPPTGGAAPGPAPACVALEPDGRCAIYPARPIVCRSHGLPLRFGRGPGGLPVVDACSLNFTGPGGPAAADSDCILDQETLSTILLAIDAEHARAAGRTPGERSPLEALLAAAIATPSAG